jgi:hypothetical protein
MVDVINEVDYDKVKADAVNYWEGRITRDRVNIREFRNEQKRFNYDIKRKIGNVQRDIDECYKNLNFFRYGKVSVKSDSDDVNQVPKVRKKRKVKEESDGVVIE